MTHAWLLYVARDLTNKSKFCPGSLLCMRLLETLDLTHAVEVQDADALSASNVLPRFVTGTPTLVDGNTRDVYTGSGAIEQLATIASTLRRDDRAVVESSRRRRTRGLDSTVLVEYDDDDQMSVAGDASPEEDDAEEGKERDQGWPKPQKNSDPERAKTSSRRQRAHADRMVDREDDEREEADDAFAPIVDQADLPKETSRKIRDDDVQRELQRRGL